MNPQCRRHMESPPAKAQGTKKEEEAVPNLVLTQHKRPQARERQGDVEHHSIVDIEHEAKLDAWCHPWSNPANTHSYFSAARAHAESSMTNRSVANLLFCDRPFES